jgi:DNA-binding CsgD family transcriptional regulator
MSNDSDDEPARYRSSLLEYAQLYPSIRERIRRITASADPVLSAKMTALLVAHERAQAGQRERMAQRFGFTPTEGRVAQFLADCGSINQYAETFGVSEGTVRVQLRSVFAKTGVHRQAELVRVIEATKGA